MGSFESLKSPEKSLLPKEIDAWIFSRYKLNGLIYLLSIDLDGLIESSDLSLPESIRLDSITRKKIHEHIKDIRRRHPEVPVLDMIDGALGQNSGNLSLRELGQMLIDYPTLRNILQEKEFISKIQENMSEKTLTPKGICKAVGDKFFPKNKKEILADPATGKAILVIYGTGKGGKYLSIYDPLRVFALPPSPPESFIDDPKESFEREKKYRQSLEEEKDDQELIDIIYSSYTEVG